MNSWSLSVWSVARCPQSLNPHKQMAAARETLTWSPRRLRAEVVVPVPSPTCSGDLLLGRRGSRSVQLGASASLHPSRGHAAVSRSDRAPPAACQQRPRRLSGAGLHSAESKRGTQPRGSRPLGTSGTRESQTQRSQANVLRRHTDHRLRFLLWFQKHVFGMCCLARG